LQPRARQGRKRLASQLLYPLGGVRNAADGGSLMKRLGLILVILGLFGARGAFSAEPPPPPPPDEAPPPPPPSKPEMPVAQPMEPPRVSSAPAATPGVSGEWVYTSQYGWVWMPYERSYTHVIEESGVAYEYVFYPGFGWRWVIAPWVLGLGPVPRWGPRGPARFYWHAHPWFRPHRR
jgi:hypothetical protein